MQQNSQDHPSVEAELEDIQKLRQIIQIPTQSMQNLISQNSSHYIFSKIAVI